MDKGLKQEQTWDWTMNNFPALGSNFCEPFDLEEDKPCATSQHKEVVTGEFFQDTWKAKYWEPRSQRPRWQRDCTENRSGRGP